MSRPRGVVSSGLKEADAAIKASAGFLWGITIIPDGTNAAWAKVYNDPDSADGTLLGQASGKVDSVHQWYDPPIVASAGMWLDIDGTNADAIVYYE